MPLFFCFLVFVEQKSLKTTTFAFEIIVEENDTS